MAEQNTQIRIEKISLLRDLLDAPLQRAFSALETQNLQFGLDWLANLAAHALDQHDTAVIYVARRNAEDFVACPLKINSRHKRVHSLSTFYTCAYLPVICSKQPETLLLALFQHLAQVENISMLTIAPMNATSPVFKQLQNALPQAGWRGCHDYFCFGNWIHTLEGCSYETYHGSRPSNVRNTIARKSRKFFAGDRGKLEIIRDGDALEYAIASYTEIYNKSWKKQEPYQEFIPALLRLAAARGWLRLGIASYDNVPVASQIWLVSNGTAYIYKLAYDEAYKQLSVGTVLTAHMMQHAIEDDGVTCIDYLSGDDAYKADWMSERRQQYGIAAYNPRTGDGMVMLAAYTLKKIAKKLRKQWQPRT